MVMIKFRVMRIVYDMIAYLSTSFAIGVSAIWSLQILYDDCKIDGKAIRLPEIALALSRLAI